MQVIVEENNDYLPQPAIPQDRYIQEERSRSPQIPQDPYAENLPQPYNPYQTESPRVPTESPPTPQIRVVEHEVNTRVGMNVDLTCMNVGSMPLNTETVWTRAGDTPIARRHKKDKGILHIRGAKKSDEGLYLCQLIEPSGTVLFQLRANLIVKGIYLIKEFSHIMIHRKKKTKTNTNASNCRTISIQLGKTPSC